MNKKLTCSLLAFTLAFNAAPMIGYNQNVYATDEVVTVADEVATVSNDVIGYGAATPTQEQIKAFYATQKIADAKAFTDDYTTQPTLDSKTYTAAGALTDVTQTHALNTLNYIRYIAGLSSNVSLDTTYTTQAQAAAVLNTTEGTLNHHTNEAYDSTAYATYKNNSYDTFISDSLYSNAIQGAQKSNLAYKWAGSAGTAPAPTNLYDFIVNQWMEDGDSNNIERVGHRRWCLNPTMGSTGFGAFTTYGPKTIGSATYNGTTTYSAMYSADTTGTSSIKGVAWPAQNTPVDLFTSEHPWSYTKGSDVTGTVTVELTNTSTNKVYNFDSSSTSNTTTGCEIYVSNTTSGQTGCVIFDPNISYSAGDSFWVEIKEGGTVIASYPVNFFDVTGTTTTTPDPTEPTDPTVTTYSITNNLTNITSSNTATSVNKETEFTTTLTAGTGYNLPSSITVTMGGNTLTASTDYSYDSSTGEVSIDSVTGNVVITAVGETLPSVPTPAIVVDGMATGSGSGVHKVGSNLTIRVTGISDLTGYSFQWYADDVAISGATDDNFDLTHTQLGKVITVGVKAPSDSTTYNSNESKSTGTTTVVAYYDITFIDTTDGSTLPTTNPLTTSGDATLATFPADPTDSTDATTFAGWYDESGNKVTASTVFTGNTTVTAEFIEIKTLTDSNITIEEETTVTVDPSKANDVSSLFDTIDGTTTVTSVEIKVNTTADVDNFIIIGLDDLLYNLTDTDVTEITITIPTADSQTSTNVVWTVPVDADVKAKIDFAVTINDDNTSVDSSVNTNGSITFSHTGDLVGTGSGLTLQFPVPSGTIASTDTIKLTKRENTSQTLSGSYVNANTIKATFTNCSTWDISATSTTNNNNNNNNSSGSTTTATTNSTVTIDGTAGTSNATISTPAVAGGYTVLSSLKTLSVTSTGTVNLTFKNLDTSKNIALFRIPTSGGTWTEITNYTVTSGASAIMTNTGLIAQASSHSGGGVISFTGTAGYTYMLAYVSGTGSSYVGNSSSGSSSSGSSSSSSGSLTANQYSSGTVRVNGTYLPALSNVLVGELVNLNYITSVNGQDIISWYYDEALTSPITDPTKFVVTSNTIANGIYAKTTGTASNTLVDGSVNAGAPSTTPTTPEVSYTPSVVPSTFAKLLNKLF